MGFQPQFTGIMTSEPMYHRGSDFSRWYGCINVLSETRRKEIDAYLLIGTLVLGTHLR